MTSLVAENDILALVDSAHARRFDEELIVLDLKGGDYYVLNGTGTLIWERLLAGSTPAQIARVLALSHDVNYERAVNDCVALANELCARGLLRRV